MGEITGYETLCNGERLSKISCIYLITNPKGYVYVGQTKYFAKRYNSYKNIANSDRCKIGKINNSIKKYGFKEHSFEILKVCPKDELNFWEKFYIKLFYSNNKYFGLNLTSGGDCCEVSEEVKMNASIRMKNNPNAIATSIKNARKMHQMVADGIIPHPMKGKTHTKESIEKILKTKSERVYKKRIKIVSEETKEKLRKINLGKKYSEESKQKKRDWYEANKHTIKKPPVKIWTDEERKKWSEITKGDKNGNYGKGMKPHVKEALKKANVGRKLTDEHINNLSKARKGKPKSEDWKRKISEATKGKPKIRKTKIE